VIAPVCMKVCRGRHRYLHTTMMSFCQEPRDREQTYVLGQVQVACKSVGAEANTIASRVLDLSCTYTGTTCVRGRVPTFAQKVCSSVYQVLTLGCAKGRAEAGEAGWTNLPADYAQGP
jgi:hypothetical protein